MLKLRWGSYFLDSCEKINRSIAEFLLERDQRNDKWISVVHHRDLEVSFVTKSVIVGMESL